MILWRNLFLPCLCTSQFDDASDPIDFHWEAAVRVRDFNSDSFADVAPALPHHDLVRKQNPGVRLPVNKLKDRSRRAWRACLLVLILLDWRRVMGRGRQRTQRASLCLCYTHMFEAADRSSCCVSVSKVTAPVKGLCRSCSKERFIGGEGDSYRSRPKNHKLHYTTENITLRSIHLQCPHMTSLHVYSSRGR